MFGVVYAPHERLGKLGLSTQHRYVERSIEKGIILLGSTFSV